MTITTGFEGRIVAEEFPDWTSSAEELSYLTALFLVMSMWWWVRRGLG